MAYSFKPGTSSVGDEFRRVAKSQLEKGLAELQNRELPQSDVVHQARKRCKKMRGLFRIVRPVFEEYSKENRIFRDAARTLSDTRDTTARLETLYLLESEFDDDVRRAALEPLRSALQERRAEVSSRDTDERLSDMRDVFSGALERVGGWDLDEDGSKAFAEGAAKTYDRTREAMEDAYRAGTADAFHEWRKRVKYHHYHTRLLKKAWPEVMDAFVDESGALSDLLGDHHDFAELHTEAARLLGSDNDTTELVYGLAKARQASIETSAYPLGRQLLAEKPKALAKRWSAWWDAAANAA